MEELREQAQIKIVELIKGKFYTKTQLSNILEIF